MAGTHRILVVEQDLLAALTIKHMLMGGGLRDWPDLIIECRTSLRGARDAVDHADFAAILLDPELPDSHAHHTVASLHQHSPETPIVAIGVDGEGVEEACILAGAATFIPKGQCTTNLLMETLQEVAGHGLAAGFKAAGQPA